LELFRMEELGCEDPWDGRSPRTLTRAFNDVRFKAKTLDEEVDLLVDEQYRRFLNGS